MIDRLNDPKNWIDSMPNGLTIRYKGVEYKTGNSGHGIVDLYNEDGQFVKNCLIKEITILKGQGHIAIKG